MTDYYSDDCKQRRKVKIATVQYRGQQFSVLGKENVIKLLRDTQSVRTLMEDNQLERLVQHDGNIVNNYTANVFRWQLFRLGCRLSSMKMI